MNLKILKTPVTLIILLLFGSSVSANNIEKKLFFDVQKNCPLCKPFGAEGNFGVDRMHTGEDYIISTGTALKSMSYGQVKFKNTMPLGSVNVGRPDHGMGNVIEMSYLLDDGTYVTVSFNHLNSFDDNIGENSYVALKQEVAFSGASGQESLTYWSTEHLHLEFRKQPRKLDNDGHLIFPWGYTNNRVDPSDYGYLDPDSYINSAEISLPTFSKEENKQFYGYVNTELNAKLNIAGSFDSSSIIVRDFFNRTNINQKGELDDSLRFLGGKNLNLSVNGIKGSNNYSKGDYLFAAYVNNDGESRFGYPVKFSILNESEVIIDNEQSPALSSIDTSFKRTGVISNHIPGYHLNAYELESDASAKWQPNRRGRFLVNVHIPDDTNYSDITYKFCVDDVATCQSYKLQKPQSGWQNLSGNYLSFSQNGFVEVNTETPGQASVVPVDAIKFSYDHNDVESFMYLLGITENSAHKLLKHYMEYNPSLDIAIDEGNVLVSSETRTKTKFIKYSFSGKSAFINTDSHIVVSKGCLPPTNHWQRFFQIVAQKTAIHVCEG